MKAKCKSTIIMAWLMIYIILDVRPEGVATAGKITHMSEGLIRAACPT